ncbi:amino acid adenylation domain-containing protein [Streptomyces sp. SL13]|uniref:Amino acid adenylation domain-containing protein n=1 Tax=Streptantibioticus silvisoli TaxID=2705255 RepID=A0AA90K9J0_9ACTN|nr:non-ribosomal peptide synthetase [Streptantibioticus silvisoli]MDI5970947.1 amino acid adenylation domain-containing protein [Streptantibioticus silvisoli]
MTAPRTPGQRGSAADRFASLTREQRVGLLRKLVASGRPLPALPAVVPVHDGGRTAPLSPAQRDLWVFESLHPGSAAMNLCGAYHFERPVDPGRLEAALRLVRSRHDGLRGRVGGTVGDLRVGFPAEDGFAVERLDLRGGTTTLDDVVAAVRARPFDLREDDLLRACHVVLDETRSTLVLSLHHIITDWYSFDILHTEFAEAYATLAAGGPAPARPAVQYADYAAWQGELEEAGVLDAQLGFWRRHLERPPGPLRLGAPARAAAPGTASVPFGLTVEEAGAVRAFARAHDTSVFAVLISAFAVLVHRLSGSPDFVLGTPVANRGAQGLERLIGYVMNAVPTRWRIDADRSFEELLGEFAGELPQVLAHAAVPVGRIVAELAPERTADHSPLFQWVFMHLGQQRSIHTLPEGARFERVHTGGEHDCVVVLRDTPDAAMDGLFEFRTELFDPDTVGLWTRSFTVLLADLLARPHLAVNRAALLTEAERRTLTADPQDGPRHTAPDSPALQVARRAALTPHAPAVEAPGETLSYARLEERVARAAGRLAALGVGPETVVGLAMRRGSAFVVAVLAVDRAGGAHLHLDPAHPPHRTAYLVRDAAPALVLTGDDVEPPQVPVRCLPWRTVEEAGPTAAVPAAPADPRAAAYVIHTSGSTGEPKGVVVTRAGLAALTASTVARFGLDERSRVAQLASGSFDASIGELCAAFGCGGTLVVPGPEPLAGEALADFLDRNAVTWALIPPTVLASMPPGGLPALRTLLAAGESLGAGLAARWADGRCLVNGYGPTEATVIVTYSDPLLPGDLPPVGRPQHDVRAHVLDALLQPVPAGAVGELYLAGPCLARGYLGRPGATAGRFVPDPFTTVPGGRMYRTGDLAHRRADGQLVHEGRADDQIKVRGFRIEPGEVEAALTGHPTVRRAAVTVREDRPGDRRMVGYVVARPGAAADGTVLREYLAGLLPTHLVPSAVVVLDDLPTTVGGKLDRRALPAPSHAPAGPRAPLTAREAVLCELAASILGLERVSPDEGFFTLGGDSIMALNLVSAAHTAGLEITGRDVFTARTIAALAALAREADGTAGADGDDRDEDGPFAPTPIMRWWLETGGPLDAFHLSLLLPLPAGTDHDAVEAALTGLTARHEALRLRLSADHGTVRTAAGAPGTAHRLKRVGVPGADAAGIGEAARREAAVIRIDPTRDPLVRAVRLDAGPDRPGGLLLTVHHLGVDGVSMRVIARDLERLLAGDRAPAAPGTSFRRWARSLHEDAVTARRESELPAWTAALDPAGAVAAPGQARPGVPRRDLTRTLDARWTLPLLTRLPAEHGCGVQDVLLTALAAAVTRADRDGAGCAVLHTEGHGRHLIGDARGDLSGTVGWFTNQYPVRVDLAGGGGPGAFWADGASAALVLKDVAGQLRAVPGDGLGFGQLRHLNPRTAPLLARLPRPWLRFNYLGRLGGGPSGTPRGGELLGVVGEMPAAHALEIDAYAEDLPGGPRLTVTWSWPQDVLTEDAVRDLADGWFAALRLLAGDDDPVPPVPSGGA